MNSNVKDNIGKILFVIGILFLGYMLISPLNSLFIHVDEYFTNGVMYFSITDMIAVTANDVHPPLYYLILKAFTFLLSSLNIHYDLLYVTKVISAIPYVIILLISYFKIKKDYGWLAAGLIPFALVVMSEYLMYFITGRMYSWGLLFLFISFIYYKDLLNTPNLKSWAIFTLFSVLGAYTHYFVAIPSFILYLILLVKCLKDTSELKMWFASVIVAVIAYVPWIFTLLHQVGGVSEGYWIKPIDFHSMLEFFSYYATNLNNIIIILFAIITLVFFCFVLFKNYDELNGDNLYVLSGILAFFGTIFIGVAVSLAMQPILIARYLMPAGALLWFSIAVITSKIKNRKTFAICLALIMLLACAGIYNVVDSTQDTYKSSLKDKQLINSIDDDGNMVIFNAGTGLMGIGQLLEKSDIYTYNCDNVKQVDINKLNDTIKFTKLDDSNITSTIDNHDGKIFFVASSGQDDIDLEKKEIGKIGSTKYYEIIE